MYVSPSAVFPTLYTISDVLNKDPKQVDKFFGPKIKRTKLNGRVNEHCRIVHVK